MLRLLRRGKKGQSAVEYATLLIIVLAVLLAMGNYFKRGMQGRWKSAVDDLGDQYDPQAMNSSVTHTLLTNSITSIVTMCAVGGFWTSRTDVSNSIDSKSGFIAVGANSN